MDWDIQWTRAISGINGTAYVGVIDAGAGLNFQWTNKDSVYDLYGKSGSFGASGGPLLYLGADLLSLSDPLEKKGTVDGFQITGGYGLGLDIHYGGGKIPYNWNDISGPSPHLVNNGGMVTLPTGTASAKWLTGVNAYAAASFRIGISKLGRGKNYEY